MFVDPLKVIEEASPMPGMVAADFGSGAGFYSLSLAKVLGTHGKVFALDIRKEMLEVIRSKARAFHLSNLEALWADLEALNGSNLKEMSVDIVVISNILFQVQNKERLAKEALRILRPTGKLILVEWAEESETIGPPMKERVNRDEAESLFLKSGFVLDKEFKAGEHHYGLLFKKP